jgi:hypothetical protein
MENINKLRIVIRSLIKEAIMTNHFRERKDMRLDSEDSDFPGHFPNFKKNVFDAIDFLEKKVDFEKDLSLAIWLRCPQVFTAYDKQKNEKSVGNRLYFIVRNGNELTTLLFENPERKRDLSTDYYVPFFDLQDYVLTNNKSYLTDKDIKRILNKNKPVVVKPAELIYNVNAKKWVFDKEKETFFLRNDPKKIYNVYDILDNKIDGVILSQEQKDEILSFLI